MATTYDRQVSQFFILGVLKRLIGEWYEVEGGLVRKTYVFNLKLKRKLLATRKVHCILHRIPP